MRELEHLKWHNERMRHWEHLKWKCFVFCDNETMRECDNLRIKATLWWSRRLCVLRRRWSRRLCVYGFCKGENERMSVFIDFTKSFVLNLVNNKHRLYIDNKLIVLTLVTLQNRLYIYILWHIRTMRVTHMDCSCDFHLLYSLCTRKQVSFNNNTET